MQTEELAKINQQNAALAALGIEQGDRRGKENITAADQLPSFIKIAQKMSDELEPSHKNYIEALRANQLFNSRTGEIYGASVEIIPVAVRKHAIQFEDQERGLTFERNVAWNDPRCEFGKDGEKPRAVRFYDFAVIVLPSLKPAILSCKVTNIESAKEFNGALADLPGPAFAFAFKVGVRPETRTVKGKEVTYGVFEIGVKSPRVVTPGEFAVAAEAYKGAVGFLEKAEHVVDGEVVPSNGAAEDLDGFDTSTM
jgi:hypothetical protein